MNGRMECPICQKDFKNLKIHFDRIKKCGDSIDITHFIRIYEEFKRESERERNRIKAEKYKEKQRDINPSAFKQKAKEIQETYRKKQKTLNPDEFNLNVNEASKKYQKKQKEGNPDYSKLKQKTSQKYRKNQKEAIDETTRINNFNRAVLFGPIFTCSCCSRQMYENGVTNQSYQF